MTLDSLVECLTEEEAEIGLVVWVVNFDERTVVPAAPPPPPPPPDSFHDVVHAVDQLDPVVPWLPDETAGTVVGLCEAEAELTFPEALVDEE